MAARQVPPDVLFAQKASAVVRAAGFDPRSIDLESFRSKASEIFTLAFMALYKETMPIEPSSALTKEEQAINAQYVIDSLIEKTGNIALEQIAGIDVVNGSHRAIGYLVGILFAEGQRMWMARNDTTTHREDGNAIQDDISVKAKLKKKKTAKKMQATVEAIDERAYEDRRNRIMDHLQVAPNNDVEGLLEKIKYLETKLEETKSPVFREPNSTIETTEVRKIDENFGYGHEEERNGRVHVYEDGEDASGVRLEEISGQPSQKKKRSKSAKRRQEEVTRRLYGGHVARLSSMMNAVPAPLVDLHRPGNEGISEDVRPRWKSPESPPATATQRKSLTTATAYTYSSAGRKVFLSVAEQDALQRHRAREANGVVLDMGEQDEDVPQTSSGGGGGDRKGKGPRPQSARATAFSAPQYAPSTQQRQRPTSASRAAAAADGPSPHIQQEIDSWVNKIRALREQEAKLVQPPQKQKVVEKVVDMKQSRFFGAYNRLDKLDLVFSVEHCHSCEHHSFSLRHDPKGYVSTADATLRMLAQIAHESNLCVRVGVIRFRAKIALKPHAEQEADSRIGAFEVQAAYRNKAGQVQHVLLHSKIVSQRWPSKSVIEKRLQAFFSTAKIASFNRNDSALYTQTAVDGAYAYPVGAGPWESTALADPYWEFSQTSPTAATLSGHGAVGVGAAPVLSTHGGDGQQKLKRVQWVFDSRTMADMPTLAVGSTVRVSSLSHPKGGIERNSLLGVVKSFPKAMHLWQQTVTVRLKYHTSEVTVAVNDCTPLLEYIDRDPDYTPQQVPAELEALLLLANGYSSTSMKSRFEWECEWGPGINAAVPHIWYVMSAEDQQVGRGEGSEVSLGRASFFHQIRDLVGEIESRMRTADLALASTIGSDDPEDYGTMSSQTYKVRHPSSQAQVDLQLAYSEEVLDWVFNMFGNVVSMSKLEKLAGTSVGLFGPNENGQESKNVLTPRTELHKPPTQMQTAEPAGAVSKPAVVEDMVNSAQPLTIDTIPNIESRLATIEALHSPRAAARSNIDIVTEIAGRYEYPDLEDSIGSSNNKDGAVSAVCSYLRSVLRDFIEDGGFTAAGGGGGGEVVTAVRGLLRELEDSNCEKQSSGSLGGIDILIKLLDITKLRKYASNEDVRGIWRSIGEACHRKRSSLALCLTTFACHNAT